MTSSLHPNVLPERLVAASEQMIRVRDLARRAGQSDAKALITGESGVGKELVAREIVTHSARARAPFVTVNCAAVAETLLESELFGHVKGSFTGAFRDHPGKLQTADGGTLFLDEVGEMSLRMQALLLRFLENGEVQPVGDSRPGKRVNVRVIAATNRSLHERVAAGLFREDLLYRLRVIHIEVPPLRQRPEDITALIEHLSAKASRSLRFSDEARRCLLRYRWPGNVRELQNVVEQLVWLTTCDVVEASDLPQGIRGAGQRVIVSQERRRQVADQLYEALVQGDYQFWAHVYPLFLARDITRHDVRELVRRGLAETRGNYRALLRLFGMPADDYHRFHNFLAAHSCKVDYRLFRSGEVRAAVPRPPLPPPGELAHA
jgi:DNA-binding NtrC family response regulator